MGELQRKRNVRKYIGANVAVGIAEFLVDSYATIYLLSKGATYTQIGIMWMLYLGVTAITDYPTGGLADKYGRRKMYAIGIFLTALSYFIILSKNMNMLYLSYAIKGFATSLISGSLTAWFSCAINDEQCFDKAIAKNNFIMNVSSVILPVVFLLMNKVNLDVIFILCAVIHVVVGGATLIMCEENYGSSQNILNIYSDTIRYFIKNRVLLFIAFVNVALYLFFTIFYYIWQPLALNIVKEQKYLPLYYGIYSICMGLGGYIVNLRFFQREKKAVIAVMGMYFMSFILFAMSCQYQNLISFVSAMLFFGLAGGVVFIFVSSYINRNADEKYKASIYSLISSIATITNVIFQVVFGKIIDLFGYQILISIGIIVVIIITVGLLCVCSEKSKYVF